MKELKIHFTEAEFRRLKRAKMESGYNNWVTFVVARCCKGVPRRNSL